MRFLIDMPLSPALAAWLVRRGHDAVHAADAGLSSSLDQEILSRARDEQWVVITADLDYPRLLALAGNRAPGLILFRGGNFSEPDTLAIPRTGPQRHPRDRFDYLHHRGGERANSAPAPSDRADSLEKDAGLLASFDAEALRGIEQGRRASQATSATGEARSELI